MESERQQREQERQKQAAESAGQRRATFASLYAEKRQSVTQGESEYLIAKGLDRFTFPLLPDGSVLLELVDESGAVAAAQTITPQGEKRLLTGSAKRGAYHAVNAPEQPQSVLIAEGLATALSVHLMRPEALTVAAIDAGNLLPVAEVMRRKHPKAQIIIAADNDHHQNGEANTGRRPQRKPPYPWLAGYQCHRQTTKPTGTTTTSKTGWKSLRLRLMIRCTRFRGAVKPQLQAIEGGKSRRKADAGDIAQMAASQKARLLSSRWDMLAVNPDSGAVYCYESGVWVKLPDSELERVMVAIFDEHEAHYTEKGIKSVVATMKLQIPVIGERSGDLIGFDNGVYDLATQTFSAHSPGNWLMNHNGITYTPPAPGRIFPPAPRFYPLAESCNGWRPS